MQWIFAMRPRNGAGAALLVISGFRHGHQPIDWRVVLTVFFITSMAMLWNDYHDRDIDAAKGRPLASNHPIWFLRYALAFVAISFGLSVWVWSNNSEFGMLCMGMWITSIAYCKAQRNPVLKNMIVSLDLGATVAFPLLAGSENFTLWLMASSIVVISIVKEFVKDVEDMEVDRGKKRTLPLVMNSRIKKNLATRWKLSMNLLLVTLMF